MNDFNALRPYAPRFEEHYWGPGRGIEEKIGVFVLGTRLPELATGLAAGQTLSVGELGFGTGLNLALALGCFAAYAPQGCHFRFYSTEAYPLALAELNSIHAAWPPELATALAPLRAAWPTLMPGWNEVPLTPSATLHLWVGEALEGLNTQAFVADCWWLDGFSPLRNPGMWEEPLMAQVGAHSRVGTRLATYSVAGVVRKRLQAIGFKNEKVPGVPPKRQRLEGVFMGLAKH